MATGYRISIPATTELHRREIALRIAMLRDMHVALDMKEVWFASLDDVVNYLNDVAGVRTPQGRRITVNTLRRWYRKAGFPLYRAKPKYGRLQISTSNVLIMAWLWAWRVYKATRAYKPTTSDLIDATGHLL